MSRNFFSTTTGVVLRTGLLATVAPRTSPRRTASDGFLRVQRHHTPNCKSGDRSRTGRTLGRRAHAASVGRSPAVGQAAGVRAVTAGLAVLSVAGPLSAAHFVELQRLRSRRCR
ncbi:hypothetical protein H0E86_02815 [Streptomyces sp. SCSIO-PteL053]|nr:hypothetical protein H0E86_02815 [Streptomyces sp. SCSIO-PteL053]